MSIGYTVDHEQCILFVRGWGVLTDAQVRAQAQAMEGDPEMASDRIALIDLRDVTSNQLTSHLLQHFPTALERATRRAIVVGDEFGFGVAREYSGWVADQGAVIVTQDVGEALSWLQMPAATRLPDKLDAVFEG